MKAEMLSWCGGLSKPHAFSKRRSLSSKTASSLLDDVPLIPFTINDLNIALELNEENHPLREYFLRNISQTNVRSMLFNRNNNERVLSSRLSESLMGVCLVVTLDQLSLEECDGIPPAF